MGDGYTEVGVIAAHKYWQKYGFASTSFLPCLSESEVHCEPYTHYPPGAYLFSTLLLRTGETFFSFEQAIMAARFVLFILAVLISSFALWCFSFSLSSSALAIYTATIVLGISRGFWLFADNFFAHGLVLSFFGALLAITLQKTQQPLRRQRFFSHKEKLFLFFSLLSTIFSVELIPALFLLPCLVVLRNKDSAKHEVLRLWMVAFFSVVFVMGIRLAQNAWQAGSLAAALQDWFQVIHYRILGGNYEGREAHFEVQANAQFAGEYLAAWLDHQRRLITKLGLIFLPVSFLYLLVKKEWNQVFTLLAVILISLSWSFVFFQHAIIHLFTFRYIVWSLCVGVIFVMSDIDKKLRKRMPV